MSPPLGQGRCHRRWRDGHGRRAACWDDHVSERGRTQPRPGQTVDQAFLADLAERVRTLEASRGFGLWRAYTPVWTSASAPQPAVGDGTLTGRWALIGKTLLIRIRLVA